MQYTTEELREAARQIDSLLHKLRAPAGRWRPRQSPSGIAPRSPWPPGGSGRWRSPPNGSPLPKQNCPGRANKEIDKTGSEML